MGVAGPAMFSLGEPEVKLCCAYSSLVLLWARLWPLQVRFPPYPWVLHNEAALACKFACMDRGLGMGIYIACQWCAVVRWEEHAAVVHVLWV